MTEEIVGGFALEHPQTPEQAPEFGPSKIPEIISPLPTAAPTPTLPRVANKPRPVASAKKDPTYIEIETVLSENIADLYKQLTAEKKQQFKVQGENVATQISGMLKSGIVRLKKILDLIFDWLKMIPGINKFYLEQEAKIKADKILFIYEQQRATP